MKNKKCEKCNEKSMKTFYIRDYHKGMSFLNEKPYFKNVMKQTWNSIGLICTNCFNIEITDSYLNYYWNNYQDKIKQKEIDFREIQMNFAKYKHNNKKYIYSKKERIDNEQFNHKIFMLKFWRIYYANKSYQYIKGIKSMKKYRYTKQDLKDRELTDNQILRKAEIILLERKLKGL